MWSNEVNAEDQRGRPRDRRLLLLAVVVAFLTIAAACSSPTAPAPTVLVASEAAATVDASHNQADVTFAQMMIIHHEATTDVAGLAQQTSTDGHVRELAERINSAQGPEINEMRRWLETWGEPLPENSGLSATAHEGMGNGRQEQQDAMNALLRLDGAAFDKRFLSMMLSHDLEGLAMATQHVGEGQNRAGVDLAKHLIATQRSEIAEMRTLLGRIR